MYTLEDITTLDLIHSKSTPEKARDLLKKYDVRDFQKLEFFVQGKYDDFNNEYFYKLLYKAYDTLANLNSGRWIVQTYSWPNNESLVIQKLIDNTDSQTLGASLPYLVNSCSLFRWELNKLSIKEIKYLSSKITLEGKNALIHFRNAIGPKRIADFIDRVYFYNAQLDRVLKVIPNKVIPNIEEFNGNLFTYQQNEKLALVQSNFENILRRLFNLSNSFKFGKVNEALAKNIINSYIFFTNNTGYTKRSDFTYRLIALPLLDMIANYTTLEELKKGPTDQTLKRFIK